MKLIGFIVGKKGKGVIEGLLGLRAEIESELRRALRGGDKSDEQYLYDIFFRNCHTFAERLAIKISTSRTRTRLFFLRRANAKTLLYNQMTLNSMPPSLQANLHDQQQQVMLANLPVM